MCRMESGDVLQRGRKARHKGLMSPLLVVSCAWRPKLRTCRRLTLLVKKKRGVQMCPLSSHETRCVPLELSKPDVSP